ncbi:MAG: 3-dehydroquinate synthase family protein, partial [Bacteroidota bacterium]
MTQFPSYLTITNHPTQILDQLVEKWRPDKIAVLVDENTFEHCLPLVKVEGTSIIQIESGESNKNLETCSHIWSHMTQHAFTRKSLLVNLGGGVIGDMGGFAASTYKRGIKFVNMPSTLLSQVDASIGGKLGIDFEGLKNHIGLFREPDHVIVYPGFLATLPQREMKSGFAEVIKHSLIADKTHWEYLKTTTFNDLNWNEMIPKSIAIKQEVVSKDPTEQGYRKVLNFGHTLGHAIESHFLNSETPL